MVTAENLIGRLAFAIVASLVIVLEMPVNSSEYVYLLAYAQDGGDSYSDGYDRGYEDSQDHPINEQIRDGESGYNEEYRSGYLDGFLDGCLSVEGNDEDICDSAVDAL
jgi:hypothetical protein